MSANEPARSKKIAPIPGVRRRRPRLLSYMLTMMMAATMIATGGFGAFPPNELTSNAAQLISQNFPAEIIQPVNLVLEQAAAPTLEIIERSQSPNAGDEIAQIFENLIALVFSTAQPTEMTSTGAIPASNPQEALQATIENAIPTVYAGWTKTAEAAITRTAVPSSSAPDTQATPTPPVTGTVQPGPTSTPQPGQTLEASATATLSPTSVIIYIPPPPTNTRKPKPPTDTPLPPTLTPTITLSPTPTFGPQLIITNVSFNGGGSSISVAPGSTVTVTYDFQVMSDGCPGCITQLVTGLGTPGSHGGTCAFDGIAGVSPGVTGSENATLTMPTAEGTYNVTVLYSWQNNCADALAAYGPGGEVIGQITVACGAGLNLLMTVSAGTFMSISWDGTTWGAVPSIISPNECTIDLTNNSAAVLPAAFKFADSTCISVSIPAGYSTNITGDNLAGECPLEFYVP